MIVLKSLVIICVISGIVAAIFNPVFGFDHVKTFTATTGVQLVLGIIISSIREVLSATKIKELQVQELAEYAKQGMDLKCAHCGHTHYIPLRFDEHNAYECPSCKQSNAVYINITVARETNMSSKLSVTTSSINNDESIAIESFKND